MKSYLQWKIDQKMNDPDTDKKIYEAWKFFFLDRHIAECFFIGFFVFFGWLIFLYSNHIDFSIFVFSCIIIFGLPSLIFYWLHKRGEMVYEPRRRDEWVKAYHDDMRKKNEKEYAQKKVQDRLGENTK